MSTATMISEFVGTFILLAAILITGNAVYITAAFLGAITIAGLSGGHLNPVVSMVMALKGAIPTSAVVEYVVAQAGGALAALAVSNLIKA